jgi:hypothetical protein
VSAFEAHVEVTAERRSPAAHNSAQDCVLLRSQRVATPVVRAVLTDDVRKLECGTCRRVASKARDARIRHASAVAVARVLW